MPSAEAIVKLSGMEAGDASVERIKHGLTNESWLVSALGERRVVRISNPEDDALQINRSSEAVILAAVGDAGIGPDVIVCDPARQLLVTRYVGETWSEADTLQVENIDRIAALLRKLHALEVPTGVQSVNLLAVVEGYLGTLDQRAIVCELTSPTLRARARESAIVLYRRATECLCHNDVHSLNLVESVGGGLRLIDWEYAGLGEPLFDVAALSVYHRYDQALRERLLSAYLRGGEPAESQRFEVACWLFEYVRDLWTAVRELPSVERVAR